MVQLQTYFEDESLVRIILRESMSDMITKKSLKTGPYY